MRLDILSRLRVHAQQAGWSAQEVARATLQSDGGAPCVEFVAEAKRCPVCDGALTVYKTRSRQVITLEAGALRATETLKRCAEDPAHPVMGSSALAALVKSRQRYGYDLIVHAGCARYLQNKQREEIQAELYRQRGITLSTGSLSHLCDRFLSYLEALLAVEQNRA